MKPVTLTILVVTTLFAACDLLDPARPIAHPDTEVFGILLALESVEGEHPAWIARVQIGLPRDFLEAEEEGGHVVPALEEGIVAEVLVSADTVVLVDGRPGFIDSINPGTEVAVIPVVGSTRMIGTTHVTVEAGYFLDFDSFRTWRLPGLANEDEVQAARVDADRINSDGVERAPVVIADGRVLYFTARLRPPIHAGENWIGAPRPGLRAPEEGEAAVERSYRSELGEDGWLPPTPMSFQGLDDATRVSVTWVADDETRCLVTVEDSSGTWVGIATRAAADEPWGGVERVDGFGEAEVSDAVYLAGSQTKFVCAVRRSAGFPTDLWLYDPSAEQTAMPLQPEVNTPAGERTPRVGPANQLFFVRGDRQFALEKGAVQPVSTSGPHRIVVTDAAPAGNGKWVFVCSPNFTPVVLDQDIYVAEWLGENRLGELIPVDEWRP